MLLTNCLKRVLDQYSYLSTHKKPLNLGTEMMFRPKKKRKTGETGAGEAAAGLQAGEVTINFSAATY